MLTKRELEVLGLMAEGFYNEEIATQLFITIMTVKSHINNIYDKLGLRAQKHHKGVPVMRVRAVLWYLKNKDKINE